MSFVSDFDKKGTSTARLALSLDANQGGFRFYETDTGLTYRWDGSGWDLIAVDKTYVDALAVNVGKRGSVRAATTANITISTALNNGDTLDGVTLATGNLVLVKNQSSAAENGIYVVGASPARSSEFDIYDEHAGALIVVEEGSTNADTIWLCTSNIGGTLNTTAINFSAFTFTSPVDDTAYDATTWNGDTTHAPSKNAVRNKIESLSGSSAWTQVVNEDGSSFANFTGDSGTWSSDGTIIKQTDTTFAWRAAKFNTKIDAGLNLIMQADVKLVSSGASSDHRISLIVGFDGTTSSPGSAGVFKNNGGTKSTQFNRSTVAVILELTSPSWGNDDAFVTMRLVTNGWMLSVYADEVLIGTASTGLANSADARYIGLATLGCEGHFKNIKAWSLTLPA